MNSQQSPNHRELNSIAARNHRREVLWQITVPFILLILVFLAFVVITVASGVRGDGEAVSVWADISLIWLIIPAMVFILLFSAILGALAYLVVKLIHVIPRFTVKVDRVLKHISDKARDISDTSAKPVIAPASAWAAVKAFFRR
jgi:hypothetical protein